ncbi:hypothetical protein D3C80_1853020 [compost metagenome]
MAAQIMLSTLENTTLLGWWSVYLFLDLSLSIAVILVRIIADAIATFFTISTQTILVWLVLVRIATVSSGVVTLVVITN